MRDGAHHGEVVADEEIGQAELYLQPDEELQDAPPDRRVECGDRLVENDELRARGDGAGDGDALTLAAGERRNRAAGKLGREADPAEKRGHMLRPVPAGGDAVDAQRLGDGASGGGAGVEGRGRILEHHLHPAARPPQRAAGKGEPIAAIEADGAGVRRDQPGDDTGERRLAATGRADQAERLAGRDRQRDAGERPDAPGTTVGLLEPRYLEQRHGRTAAGPWTRRGLARSRWAARSPRV